MLVGAVVVHEPKFFGAGAGADESDLRAGDAGKSAAQLVDDFIGELAEEGLAVMLISSELPEIMGLADRVIVMHEGRIVKTFDRGAWSAEAIVSAATGAEKRA